jgi:hypothetical protein
LDGEIKERIMDFDIVAQAVLFLTDKVFFGAVIWGLLAVVFKFWAKQWGDPSDPVKLAVSILLPISSVLVVYYIGLLMEWWPKSNDMRDGALSMAIAVIVAKLIFAATTGVQEATGARPKSSGRAKDRRLRAQAVRDAKPIEPGPVAPPL